jgi:hypothetical protein
MGNIKNERKKREREGILALYKTKTCLSRKIDC